MAIKFLMTSGLIFLLAMVFAAGNKDKKAESIANFVGILGMISVVMAFSSVFALIWLR